MGNGSDDNSGLRLAIEGCGHGTLHAIYASIEEACKQKGWPGIDLLIIGGDFQSVRNAYDLNCVSMPAKYRSMCDFHEYYSGQRTAPYLTIFVGGNHEASNYLFELYYGGWVAPNIYYLGAANVLKVGSLRISGLSGIWKGFDYRKPHFERLPYNESEMKSIYHVRELDIRKLLQIRSQVDVGISHDWPQGTEWKGDWKKLFRRKQHFEDDARSDRLGSVAAKQVLDRLRPTYWFSAHLHCKYAALVRHDTPSEAVTGQVEREQNGSARTQHVAPGKNEDEIDLDLDSVDDPSSETGPKTITNADELDLELEDDDKGLAPVTPGQGLNGAQVVVDPTDANGENLKVEKDRLEEARAALPESFNRRPPPEPMEHPQEITNTTTQFLALDKCLPNRDFLQLIEIPTSSNLNTLRPLKLEYDREWLAITRAFAICEPPVFGDPDTRPPMAKSQTEYRSLIDQQLDWVNENFQDGSLSIPDNFAKTAPVYDGGNFHNPEYQQGSAGNIEYPNPQTEQFCQMLHIENPLALSEEERARRMAAGVRPELGGGRFGSSHGRGGFDRGRGRGGRGGRGRGGRGWSRGR